jgi:hypothetical protein
VDEAFRKVSGLFGGEFSNSSGINNWGLLSLINKTANSALGLASR